jgi:tetratricopeptide (TPR) repeat protein
MRAHPFLAAAAFSLGTFACPALPADATHLPDLGPEWTELRSGHLVVFSSLSPRETNRIVERLHRFRRDVFGPGRPFTSGEPTTMKVFLFRDSEVFAEYEPHGYAAYFQPAEGFDYLLLRQERWEDSLRLAFLMEGMHVLSESCPAIPKWLERGLADFYSTYRKGGNKAKVGHRVDWNLEVISGGPLIPWDRALEIGDYSPEVHDPDHLRMFQAQAWVLTHYLVTRTEAGEEGVSRYVEYLGVGSDQDAAFQHVFGFERTELPERATTYMKARDFDAIEFPVMKEKKEPVGEFAPLPRKSLLSELGEMLAALQSSPTSNLGVRRREQAEAHLNAALAIDPELAQAHRGLGAVWLKYGPPSRAVESLRKAVELDPADPHANYLLARALMEPYAERRVFFTVRETDPPAAITEARERLRQCLLLNPLMGEAHILLGRTYLHDPGDPTPGINILGRIRRLYPGRADILSTLVLLHLKKSDVEAAFPLLDPGDPADPNLVQNRSLVIGEALRLARHAFQSRDVERGARILQLVMERADLWGLSAEHAETLASLEGWKEPAAPDGDTTESEGVGFRGTFEVDGEDAGAGMPKRTTIPHREAQRQYDEYIRAVQLGTEKKYKQAQSILEELLQVPNDEVMYESIVALYDQVRYNRAVTLYARGMYREARDLVQAVERTTTDDGLRRLADLVVRNCNQEIHE